MAEGGLDSAYGSPYDLFSAFFESIRLGIWSTENLKAASGHTPQQLRQLGVEMRVIDKRNGKGGNVDPRLISEAYRLLFTEKKASSNLVLVSGDKDFEPMLADYEKQGRKVAVCFYQPVGGGASVDLLTVERAEFIEFTNPNRTWRISKY